MEQVAERLLVDAVGPLGLLLLTQLEAVLAPLLASPGVLTRRVSALGDRALDGLAAGALEEQLHAFAAAELALGAGVARHG